MVTLASVDPMPGAAINPGAHQPQSGGEAVISKDARLGFKPGTARHEARWGIWMQGGRVPWRGCPGI